MPAVPAYTLTVTLGLPAVTVLGPSLVCTTACWIPTAPAAAWLISPVPPSGPMSSTLPYTVWPVELFVTVAQSPREALLAAICPEWHEDKAHLGLILRLV